MIHSVSKPSRRHFLSSAAKALISAGALSSNKISAGLEACGNCATPAVNRSSTLRFFEMVRSSPVVSDELCAGAIFRNTAVFDDRASDYSYYEYRQCVRGYICHRRAGTLAWNCSALHLRNGNILHPSKFQEDGIGESAYGYRSFAGCSDEFGPIPPQTRQTGWLYSANDFPSFGDIDGTEYQIRLEFCFAVVNTRDGTSADVRPLTIACCGMLPTIRACPELAKTPPVNPYWLGRGSESLTRTVLSELKLFGQPQRQARLITEIREQNATVHVCIVKPNDAEPIRSFGVVLQDAQNRPFKSSNTSRLSETRSAGTTAEATMDLSMTELEIFKSAVLEIDSIPLTFSPQDLHLE